MAKKGSQKDTSGVVFYTNSKMVISQGGTYERIKEKINAVRAVVPNKSNNEIVLVLQHFENSVDRAVQAFVDGSAVDILKEWNVTGKKKPKKKKPKPQPEALPEPAQPEAAASPTDSKEALNGFHANGSVVDGDSLDSLSEQLDSVSLDVAELESESATPELPDAAAAEGDVKPSTPSPVAHPVARGRGHSGFRGNKARPRPPANSQAAATLIQLQHDDGQHTASANKKIVPNIDKSVKDLQRCMASLTRYRVVVKEEMDTSIKRMKQTFADLQSCLMDREVALLAEMDKVKAEAMAILDTRQKKAEELRRLTDRSVNMSEEQLSELRADIKHFVSERKYDEDLGRAVKFTYELEPLKNIIMNFGQVYRPQTGYSSRSRCSSASSSITGPSPQESPQPPPPQTQPLTLASGPGGRSGQTHRQGYQGNRRSGQGQYSGQRYNGGSFPDRNPNRTRGRPGDGAPPSAPPPASPPSSATSNGPTHSAPPPPRSDRPAPNGLPQRAPRTRCP